MIKIFATIAITLASLVAHARSAAVEDIPFTGRLSSAAQDEIRRKLDAVGGCNANVCFAIDGSGAISSHAFLAQKNFVLDVVSVLVDDPVELAAVQYATSVRTISRLTSNDMAFNLAVRDEKQLGGESFVVGGISACFSSLIRRLPEPVKIVLLGDGQSTIGSSASARADLFRKIGGDICVVEAGTANHGSLLAIAGGKRDHVFNVGDFFGAISIDLIVERLVLEMCGAY